MIVMITNFGDFENEYQITTKTVFLKLKSYHFKVGVL